MKLLVPLLVALFLTACAADGDNQVTPHLSGFYSSGFTGISK